MTRSERGNRRKGKGRRMRGITTEELESHLEESAGKKLPKKKHQSNEGKKYVKDRRKQRNLRAG